MLGFVGGFVACGRRRDAGRTQGELQFGIAGGSCGVLGFRQLHFAEFRRVRHVSNEPKLKFTERTMTCGLGEGKSEGFKKRKFNSGAQRNIRGEKKFKDNDDHDDEDS